MLKIYWPLFNVPAWTSLKQKLPLVPSVMQKCQVQLRYYALSHTVKMLHLLIQLPFCSKVSCSPCSWASQFIQTLPSHPTARREASFPVRCHNQTRHSLTVVSFISCTDHDENTPSYFYPCSSFMYLFIYLIFTFAVRLSCKFCYTWRSCVSWGTKGLQLLFELDCVFFLPQVDHGENMILKPETMTLKRLVEMFIFYGCWVFTAIFSGGRNTQIFCFRKNTNTAVRKYSVTSQTPAVERISIKYQK